MTRKIHRNTCSIGTMPKGSGFDNPSDKARKKYAGSRILEGVAKIIKKLYTPLSLSLFNSRNYKRQE